MTTLTIHIPESKTDLVKKLLKELDVKIEKTPNKDTIKAIEEAKSGKTKPIKDFNSFFESI